jgi:hypothetical protein
VAINLATYLTQTRRLLHDSTQQFWTDTDLTDYINDARLRTVMDTGALRSLQAFNLVAGTESYSYTGLPNQPVLDILGITVVVANVRYALVYRAFSELSAMLRPYTTFNTIPAAFSVYGQNTIYVAPRPDQAYSTEVDTVIAPTPLVDSTTVEQLISPYTEPVPYWAARLAKLEKQSYEEAAQFESMYKRRTLEIINGVYTRRLRQAYGYS